MSAEVLQEWPADPPLAGGGELPEESSNDREPLLLATNLGVMATSLDGESNSMAPRPAEAGESPISRDLPKQHIIDEHSDEKAAVPSSRKPDGEDEQSERLETEALDLAAKAVALEDVRIAYEKLCKCYRSATAQRTGPERKRLAMRLCELGEGLPEIDVFVVTWNVGNAAPTTEQLKHLIPLGNRLYDMVVVGLQECDYELSGEAASVATEYMKRRKQERKIAVDLREKRQNWHTRPSSKTLLRAPNLFGFLSPRGAENEDDIDENESRQFSFGRFMRQKAAEAEKGAKSVMTSRVGSHFASLIHGHLGADDYFMVRECELMQMRLFVFARVEHRLRISHVEYASQATGIGGVLGNKGGVAVSLRFQDLRLCFVSCHLAAHRKFLSERNRDCSDILSMLQRKLATANAGYLSDWDYVFLVGDLNYRLSRDYKHTASLSEKDLLTTDDDDIFDNEDSLAHDPLRTQEQLAGNGKNADPAEQPQAAEADDRLTHLLDLPRTLPTQPEKKRSPFTPRPSTSSSPGANRSPFTSPAQGAGDEQLSSLSTPLQVSERGVARRPTVESIGNEKILHKADCTASEHEYVKGLIAEECWEELIELDQLRREQEAGRALMGFREASIYPFAPTFKVERNPDVMYNGRRLPAYCDRILWHATPGLRNEDLLSQIELFSPREISTSDHKPVCSRFIIVMRPSKKSMRSPMKTWERGSGFLTFRSYLTRFTEPKANRGMQIVISNLSATNLLPMDIIGSISDPYIVAYSTELFQPSDAGYRPSKGAGRTRVCFRSLNCKWDDVLVIRCPIHISHPEDLLGKHLTLSIWDFDTLTKDDHMGEVVLLLDDVVHAYRHASVMVSDKFETPAREAHSHAPSRREDSDGQELVLPRGDRDGEEQFLNGRKVQVRSKQLAFSLPVIHCGKVAGTLSGLVSLHEPDEKIRGSSNDLRRIGMGWKFLAYWEQMQHGSSNKEAKNE